MIRKYQLGTRLIKWVNNSFDKPRKFYNKINSSPVNINNLVKYKDKYDNIFMDQKLLKEVDNYMIKRNVGLPQRQAILYTIWQEGSKIGSHGNGASGLVGWRGLRAKGLPNTIRGQAEKLYNEAFGPFNNNNWTYGGEGSGYKSGKEAQQAFLNAKTYNDAVRAFNYGLVRPDPNSLEKRTTSTVFQMKKSGGKMNTLQFLKNGSGIHIKKENKGKFTDYCGGKVTSECISKGKHSSNPAIRKRATFAANARKWKHKYGGFVNGVSILDSNSDAYKYVKKKIKKAADGSQLTIGQKIGNAINSPLGKFGIDVGQKLIGGIQDITNKIKYNEHLQNWKKSYVNSQSLSDAERQNFYIQSVQNQQMNNPDSNVSDIVASHDAWKLEQQELQKRKKEAEAEANQYITQMSLIDNNNQTGGFNFAGMASDILSGVLGNSKTQAITNPSSTYSQFKMPTTNFKVDMKL